ncbi:MAG TPA: sodium:alanine symporter family protein [Candidatus Aminicenantes bacterium]|nr:sodium:alanine symporter family protein [Candidatus Aminicenantes bacterium]
MDTVNNFLVMLDTFLGGSNWFPLLLLGTGIFFTLYLKFPQIRYFRHAGRIVTGKYEKDTFQGDTSHFQSLATALSGTVGTGNIGGVGLAIYIGGPAALFWMWATAFFGMCTKFVECTLSHKYREVDDRGYIAGGPMYYMKNKLNMRWLAVLFALGTIICSFGTGNMPQINNIATSIESTFQLPAWITGAVLSVLLALIIIGGIKRIAKVTEKIVPFMAAVYIIGALSVIVVHWQNVLPSFALVFKGVFQGSAAMGGFMGATMAYAFNRGVNRGIYSNEAGQGSAAIAHSAARADEPVSEGMVAILEPFIDTLVICTLTGLTILASGAWTHKVDNVFQRADMEIVAGRFLQDNPEHVTRMSAHIRGLQPDDIRPYSGELEVREGRIAADAAVTVIHARSIAEDVRVQQWGNPFSGPLFIERGVIRGPDVSLSGKSLVHSAVLTAEAFTNGLFGYYGQFIVSIGLLLFAFSTVISWSYYGDRAVTFLVGTRFLIPYRVAYIMAFFAAALIDTTVVWSLAAVAVVLMTVPNLFGILMLHKDMKRSVADYWKKFEREYHDEYSHFGVHD